jgi:hypothetical protein
MDICVGYSTTLHSVKVQKRLSSKSSSYPRPKNNVATSTNSLNPLDRKIELVTEGLQPSYKKMLKEKLSKNNANTICDYIISNKLENNVGFHSVKLKIQTLVAFSEFIGISKAFSKESTDITKDDVRMFLERYRKDERADPLHKWIGTYNLKLVTLSQFFKWLYDPDNPDSKSRMAPGIIAGIKRYRRKEESRLFTKFATKSDKGTGRGLFISKSIVESHGGKI